MTLSPRPFGPYRALIALVLIFCLVIPARADDSSGQSGQTQNGMAYDKPHVLDFVRKTPGDLKDFGTSIFKKENVPMVLLVVGSTGLLMLADERLLKSSQEAGSDLRITKSNDQRTWFSVPVGKAKFTFDGPFDSGSALYFIGDGWISVFLAGGLLSYGMAKSNNRALQTSSEIAEAVLAAGLVAQGLKHIAGRSSPFTNSESGGEWQFFPNQKQYAAHVARYDAFPSGHLTASMATLTVVAENYSEYHWIRPVGYTLFTVLGFQMMNNGVHWASDYPLAIALGYSFGRIAARKGRRPVDVESDLQLIPYAAGDRYGVLMMTRFGGRPGHRRAPKRADGSPA